MAMHGRRLDALWKLSNNTAMNEEDMTRALLTIAAAAIRPGQPFAACLLRVDGQDLIVEETISRGPEAAWLPNSGTAIPLAESLFDELVRGTGTHAENDVDGGTLKAGMDFPTRAYIASALRAGDARYVVALVSPVPLSDEFGHDDVHFMESLVTLLQTRLERRLQRARMIARAERERAAAFLAVSVRAS
jgi:hypothetical protein